MQSEKQKRLAKKFQFFKPQKIQAMQVKQIKEAATVLGISLFVYFLIFATLANEKIDTNPYWY